MSANTSIPLTEPQARRITSVLAGLEESLAEIDVWFSEMRSSGLLYQEHLNIDPGRQAAIRVEVERARRALRDIVEALKLHPRVHDASRTIDVAMLISLIDLDELDPKNLQGYGSVSEDVAGRLRAFWEALRAPVEKIRQYCTAPESGDRK